MKAATPELLELLHGSDEFVMADLYQIRLINGTVLFYTDMALPLIWQGETYIADDIIIQRGATRISNELDVDENELTITASEQHKLEGLPFVEAALSGSLDGATVKIDRAFLNKNWQIVGTINLFVGRVSDINGTRNQVKLSLKSQLELLNAPMPRNIYQAGCSRQLYDKGCKVRREQFTFQGRVRRNSTTDTEIPVRLPQKAGYFEQGVITFTSGNNKGLSRTIYRHHANSLSVALRLPHKPMAGDTFRIYPGCDKRQETCQNKFNNIVHFRGFPYIPSADLAN